MSSIPCPEPIVDADSRPFWEAADDGRLVVCFCPRCENVIWFPRPFCPSCGTWGTNWRNSTGLATIYAVTTLHGGIDDYAGCTYALAYVDVDDGPRMLTNIVDSVAADVRIGARVEVVFDVTPGGARLPRFRVQPDSASGAP